MIIATTLQELKNIPPLQWLNRNARIMINVTPLQIMVMVAFGHARIQFCAKMPLVHVRGRKNISVFQSFYFFSSTF